ncbi:MAG: isopenicillin N synthase family oxygenase [Alphaproteobacteria bacterium]|nr:isopenicillin N synthase family oxygenase [Alphaproteobacteria bacterium]
MIPCIDVAPLLGPAGVARDAVDAAIMAAAADSGFMTIRGFDAAVATDRAARAAVLRIFTLSDAGKRRLYRRKFDPARPNVYRGWFPLQFGERTHKEGIDIGPDLVRPIAVADDPLRELTPLPDEAELPGWRASAAAYYRGMESLGLVLMRAIARGLGLPETRFDAPFADGISTLRLIHYPSRRPESLVGIPDVITEDGRHITGAAHVDSGLVTLLAQDGVPGLQARARDGTWIDVPPAEGTLAINFGKLLERWSGGRIRATEHRVVGTGADRCSIPFFFEPAVDAVIAPLPLPGIEGFEPFAYGDHLWAAMMRFVEFRGLEHARPPTGVNADHARVHP